MSGFVSQRAALLLLLGCLMALGAGALHALDRGWVGPLLPLERIGFDGELARLQASELRAALSGSLQGGLLTADVTAIREAVESRPWVATATVRRVWPDALRVTIDAHQAVAIWGEGALMNADADLFRPSPLPDLALPALAGPPGSAERVLARYRALQARLEPVSLKAVALTLNERRAWTLTLDGGGVVRLGRDSVDARLARFVAAWQQLPETDQRQPAVADLRYPDGFALRWQDEE